MKDNILYLQHILDHISYIEHFIEGVSKPNFLENKEKEFAIIRTFEVIGEASKKVSPDIRKKYPDIPWKEMAAFRDVLIHNYDQVISEIVWKTVIEDIPQLKKQIQEVIFEIG